MARLHRDAEDTKNGDKGREGGERGSRTNTAVDGCINEMIDRVARYRFDYYCSGYRLLLLSSSPSCCFVRAADSCPS